MSNTTTYAVIPAAGSGQRFDETHALPKQYTDICGKPLIYHTISSFLRIEWIDKIIVVSDAENHNLMKQIISSLNDENRIEQVTGGTSRHRSIAKGIESIERNGWPQPEILIVHDGARPFLEEYILIQLVSSALKHGAAGIICKLTSTVLSVTEDNFMDRALDRSQYYSSETPQAFKYHYIKEAYNQCSQYDYEYNTECLDLVQRYTASKVKLITANPSQYFKVTFKRDVFAAEALLKGIAFD